MRAFGIKLDGIGFQRYLHGCPAKGLTKMVRIGGLIEAARYLPPILRSPLTRFLHRRLSARLTLDPDEFTGCRVLVLGPARTLPEDLADIDTRRYDLIVKMNNGLDTPVDLAGREPLRCDVLFHSLTHDLRPVTPDKLRRAGVRWLVHRTPTRGAFLNTVLADRRFGGVTRVCNLPQSEYQALGRRLGGASPTTGLMCCHFFLEAPVAELAIMGFTFFSTSYVPGYDDSVMSDHAAARRVMEKCHHAPNLEAGLLREAVIRARERGKDVLLGRGVDHAITTCSAQADR